MVVYADILFAINFSMDFISMFITQLLLNRKINKRRILLSSALGGLYGVFELLVPVNTVIGIIINLSVSLLMCLIAYYERSVRRLFSMYIVYWGVSLTLATFMSVFYSFLNKILSKYILDYSYTSVYSGARFFVITSLSIICAVIFGKAFSKEKNITSASLEVKINEKIHLLSALCDTGNMLSDPLSGRPVILVSRDGQLGKEIDNIPDIYKKYIPYRVTNSKGVLKGVIPKVLKIDGKNTDAIIAPVENKGFAGYEGCIPYSLL
ncbi:MAG: sigma-E processing peptidase SpoIIGA [Clostridia bacterium]|nr:sigma-E processing peptidase SpoIIGA [Clostridia bacterium]